jgi:hypothetical protein
MNTNGTIAILAHPSTPMMISECASAQTVNWSVINQTIAILKMSLDKRLIIRRNAAQRPDYILAIERVAQ